MILSDRAIRRRLAEGDLSIDPLDDPELQIQPASVDLRLGREFLEFRRTNIACIHPDDEREVEEYVTETRVAPGEDFVLHPGDFVLGTTKERVEVPPDLIAAVQGRSSLGRLAIVIHATAGVVDPGYCGQITLELSNLGAAPVSLKPDMRISQVIFTELTGPAERPYGADRGSKYQGQSGPQASRIGGDREFDGADADGNGGGGTGGPGDSGTGGPGGPDTGGPGGPDTGGADGGDGDGAAADRDDGEGGERG